MPVYDLKVAECPEYVAGGILVHNCDGASLAFNKLALAAKRDFWMR
jgi:hypothetical protein